MARAPLRPRNNLPPPRVYRVISRGGKAMQNALLTKLNRLCGLEPADWASLRFGEPRHAVPHEELLSDGQVVSHAGLLLSGFACRYKMVGDGRRAITAFFVPGDFTNQQMSEHQRLDFGVTTLTVCEIVDVPLATWRDPGSGRTRLSHALTLLAMTDMAIQRAWLANISQRPADKRLAHLLCELRHRLSLVDMADSHSFRMPLIQQDLADALGLSTVHVNRVMQHIKEMGLIRVRDRMILIGDLERLEKFAEFDPSYLHLGDVHAMASAVHATA